MTNTPTSVEPFEIRDFDLRVDVEWLHPWVQQDYASYWGLGGEDLCGVSKVYGELIRQGVGVHVGTDGGAPAFLFERYQPDKCELVEHYDAVPSDVGMHLLVGPPVRRVHGFTRRVFFTVMDFLLRDPSVRRIVVEPDVRNEKIRRLNQLAGFEEVAPVELRGSSTSPAKTAMLSICTREDYRRARAKEFVS